MFDDMLDSPSTSTTASSVELTAYLASPVDPTVKDPVMWWWEHRFQYPRLSRMARDYLTIPPTSVDVERVFSKGRILLSHLRNRMSPRLTRSLMCLHAWLQSGIIKDADVIDIIRRRVNSGEDEDEELGGGWDDLDLEHVD
jgi:hAT family C-terminal dimerisation region